MGNENANDIDRESRAAGGDGSAAGERLGGLGQENGAAARQLRSGQKVDREQHGLLVQLRSGDQVVLAAILPEWREDARPAVLLGLLHRDLRRLGFRQSLLRFGSLPHGRERVLPGITEARNRTLNGYGSRDGCRGAKI